MDLVILYVIWRIIDYLLGLRLMWMIRISHLGIFIVWVPLCRYSVTWFQFGIVKPSMNRGVIIIFRGRVLIILLLLCFGRLHWLFIFSISIHNAFFSDYRFFWFIMLRSFPESFNGSDLLEYFRLWLLFVVGLLLFFGWYLLFLAHWALFNLILSAVLILLRSLFLSINRFFVILLLPLIHILLI